MAGHSKWAQIKRKKAVTDARRGALFTRLLREITVAARLGGGDPEGNPRLRTAISDARTASVPKENIERAILKGAGELGGESWEESLFEGYGPGGVAILVATATDNRNRAVAELRHAFSKHGGNLGESGCVAWMFTQRGWFSIASGGLSEEALLELALEVGAEDAVAGEEAHELFCAPDRFHAVREALDERGVSVEAAELAMIPQSAVEVEGEAAAGAQRLLEALEEQDDVQNVWSNLEIVGDAGAG